MKNIFSFLPAPVNSLLFLFFTAAFLLNTALPSHAQKPRSGSKPAVNNAPKNDADSDGVPDFDDVCPASAGPASNKGCPVEGASKPVVATPPPAREAPPVNVKNTVRPPASLPTDIGGQVKLILAAAPDDFRAVRKEESKRKDNYGDDIWDGIFAQPGLNDPAIVRISKYGTYYVMPVLRGAGEAAAKTRAAALIPLLKSAVGSGATVSDEEESLGEYTTAIRNPSGAAYVEITRQRSGSLTVFVHKK